MRFITLLFVLISFDGYAQNADINILRSININRNENLDGTMKFISKTEYVIGTLTPITVCATALAKKDFKLLQKGVNMSFAVVLNTGSTYILKRIVNRDRPAQTYPDIIAMENERFHSFPSGHTSNAFVTATSLSLNFKKWYVILPTYAWATAVGYSRMHMGVHYPSDVFAGAIVGAGSALITYKANQWIKSYYEKKFVNKSIEQ
jgi:membrane-associated phospholipid phosphatase